MNRILDEQLFEQSHPLRLAYREGKLDMCDEIKELAFTLLAKTRVNPFKEQNDFERGQLAALTAIIESCNSIEQAVETKDTVDISYDA